jgi:hypothetical protein
MQDGEAITQVFYLVASNPQPTPIVIDLPKSRLLDCCSKFAFKTLADTTSSDEFKNDVNGFLWWFPSVVTSAELSLYKFDLAVNDYVVQAILNNSTYGTNYTYGFFVNDNGEKFIGYKLNWKSVLTAFGEGSYKVKCEFVSAIGGTSDVFSYEYCLKQYNADRANGTIKIEYFLNNILGISTDDYNTKDLGSLNWYNSIRLGGFFGFPTATYESDYIHYNNGQRQWVEDEQEPEFLMKLKPVAQFVHDLMRTDVMMADKVLVTDYNTNNSGKFIQKQVIKNSEYAPDWKPLQTKLASVEVKWKQEFNNLKKLRC